MIQYNRLTDHERERISKMLPTGSTFTTIAKSINRSISTVAREFKRNRIGEEYFAIDAHAKAFGRQKDSHRRSKKILTCNAMRIWIHAKLRARWSPQQISNWLLKNKNMHISHETIYQYIYLQAKGELKKELISYLRQHKRMRKSRKVEREKRGVIPDMISIHQRPAEVADRIIPGHWEGDLIIGKDHKSSIGTLVERTTRFVMIIKLKARDAESVRKAFAKAMNKLPDGLTRSLTYDRGKEMAEHKKFTIDTKMQVFFCDPHSPWQRGTNENTNGLIRDFWPKGTDFSKITAKQIAFVQDSLNERPRQTLNWDSPIQRFNQLLASHRAVTAN
jgi:IS30 family transposase